MKNEIEFVNKPVPAMLRHQKYQWVRIKKGTPMVVRNKRTSQIASSAYAAAKKLGLRFTVRQVGKDVEVHYLSKA